MTCELDTGRLIAEVARRPALYRREVDVDRGERVLLWREVGQRLYRDWHRIDKAEIYDRLIGLQRRWRSLRDAYKRELRLRRADDGTRRRRQYVYYKQLRRIFDPQQGGDNGDSDDHGEDTDDGHEPVPAEAARVSTTSRSDEEADHNVKEEATIDYDVVEDCEERDPLVQTHKPTRKRRTRVARKSKRPHREEKHVMVEPKIQTQVVRDRSPVAAKFEDEIDSEKLFLLSFAPELSRLSPSVRMWARARIANVMQEAVRMQGAASSGEAATVSPKLETEATRLSKYGNVI